MRAEQGSLNKTRIVSGRIIKDSGLKQQQMKCLNLSGRDKEDRGVSHVGEDSSHGKDGPHLSHLRPSPLTYRPTTKSEPPHAKAAPVPTRGQLPNPRPGIREDSPARGSRILCLRKKGCSQTSLFQSGFPRSGEIVNVGHAGEQRELPRAAAGRVVYMPVWNGFETFCLGTGWPVTVFVLYSRFQTNTE